MQADWALSLVMLLAAMLAAIGVLVLIAAVQGRAGSQDSIFMESVGATVFLFDGETLLDATPGARALLAVYPGGAGPWPRLLAYLGPRFPDVRDRIAQLPGEGRIMLSSDPRSPKQVLLVAELRGGLTRIALHDAEGAPAQGTAEPLAQRAMAEELDLLRATIARAPLMIWRESPQGEVTWANAAYLERAATRILPTEDMAWPLPRLFDRTASNQHATGQRKRLDLPGRAAEWVDLLGQDEGEDRLLFALPADAAVSAEQSLQDFMQTLSKTFAHLPIGLAIFDRHRKLAMFNPALLDLSGLGPDFLAARPSLFAFVDALREHNMIPEPKDYRGWRRRLTELELAETSETYEETWSLPSGQTYRVTGRPHPNGALALLFEDITTEMSRTRRYRAEVELGQAVIDAMDAAIAVFSPGGQLVMSNNAYADLWGHDPAATLEDGGIRSVCAHWRSRCVASPVWIEAERFVARLGARDPWEGEAQMIDGRPLHCRFAPLAGGATLARFSVGQRVEGAGKPRVATRKSA